MKSTLKNNNNHNYKHDITLTRRHPKHEGQLGERSYCSECLFPSWQLQFISMVFNIPWNVQELKDIDCNRNIYLIKTYTGS